MNKRMLRSVLATAVAAVALALGTAAPLDISWSTPATVTQAQDISWAAPQDISWTVPVDATS